MLLLTTIDYKGVLKQLPHFQVRGESNPIECMVKKVDNTKW